jgi:hypothetical protein
MEISKKKYITLFLIFVSFILFYVIFKWIDYLVGNRYIIETFTNNTSHTVDLPLTNTYSCTNFCGPTARCAITGHQCFADTDCPGCQQNTTDMSNNHVTNTVIPGENDAGKLTWGVTPQYSTLTTDIGTQAKLITKDKFSKPVKPNFGIDTWKSSFDQSKQLFDERYKPPNNIQFMPTYPNRYSLSGVFIEEGPIASNAYLA